MTPAKDRDIHQAAARAALDVPGVAALQPGLADRLAGAASRARHATGGAGTLPTEAGIRTERTSEGCWHVEVRCVVHEDHRVLDVAQQVREHVRAAVTTLLGQHGTPAPVAVLVTVIRTE
ncbi:Asp23/Gls24 family envelope stress response protein [Streptomyces sp. ISL-43]|uniref:Asp23/Gls24 family envelope stress response protein n=1 Tax=Streptomyces sp. ISL-43 TaxID=2819183 RepID=UPI001BE6217C|nr:Asp23/Gls24 family envelope stress response protein [Streptomyces sp. ISL-43]MBT2452527.1 Asp23/Gls24 family envelope stress response protein [Streptomyces sp. ISL-43]